MTFIEIVFVVLLILLLVGAFVPDTSWPYAGRARWALALIEIAILGWVVFGGSNGAVYHR